MIITIITFAFITLIPFSYLTNPIFPFPCYTSIYPPDHGQLFTVTSPHGHLMVSYVVLLPDSLAVTLAPHNSTVYLRHFIDEISPTFLLFA